MLVILSDEDEEPGVSIDVGFKSVGIVGTNHYVNFVAPNGEMLTVIIRDQGFEVSYTDDGTLQQKWSAAHGYFDHVKSEIIKKEASNDNVVFLEERKDSSSR